jgi:hypothetical protein
VPDAGFPEWRKQLKYQLKKGRNKRSKPAENKPEQAEIREASRLKKRLKKQTKNGTHEGVSTCQRLRTERAHPRPSP